MVIEKKIWEFFQLNCQRCYCIQWAILYDVSLFTIWYSKCVKKLIHLTAKNAQKYYWKKNDHTFCREIIIILLACIFLFILSKTSSAKCVKEDNWPWKFLRDIQPKWHASNFKLIVLNDIIQCTLRYTFLSNHNVHKCWFGPFLGAPD